MHPDGKLLAGGFLDGKSLLIWSTETGHFFQRIQGHTEYVKSASFSADGLLLASKSKDETVRLWRTDTWEPVTALEESTGQRWPPSLSFHPSEPILASLGDNDTVVRVWVLDLLSETTELERQSLFAAEREHHRLSLWERNLLEWVIIRTDRLEHPQARRHLRQGFLQRLQMMSASRQRIFTETHNRENQLGPDLTTELNIQVNAYYLNLCGALDNLAWIAGYQLRPNLDEGRHADRRFINLFGHSFQTELTSRMPKLATQLQAYSSWNSEIRRFRDPAAHRIPLYVAPGVQTDNNATQREALERRASAAAQEEDWSAWASLQDEIRSLAIYVPIMVTSDEREVLPHSLQKQIGQDQSAFLKIAKLVFEEFLGPFEPLYDPRWSEE